MIQKSVWIGIFALLMSLPLPALEVKAQEELQVKIAPASSSVASHSHNHNITLEALKRGETEYMLQSKAEDSHTIKLTRVQRFDLLDGTTLIITTGKDEDGGDFKAHQHRVTITYEGREEEASGW